MTLFLWGILVGFLLCAMLCGIAWFIGEYL
jgi:hypothetical protein